jgi:hypothetical protein
VDLSIKKWGFSIKKHGGFFQFAFNVSQRDPVRQYVIHGGRIPIPSTQLASSGTVADVVDGLDFSHSATEFRHSNQPSTINP